MSNNKKQNGYKNIDDTDFSFEPSNQDMNSILKEQHTLDFYNDDMSRKAVKSMFEINNETYDEPKQEQKKTYGYSGTNKHNTFSKPNKPAETTPAKHPKTDKYGNVEYTGVSFDYDKLNNEVKQGYKYGGSKKEIDFRNTAFSVEKLNAEKKAREEAEYNKQKLRQLELEEKSRPRNSSNVSNDIHNNMQYKTVGEVQQSFSFDTMPIRRVSQPVNHSKRKQIMTIRIATIIFVIILLLCLFLNIFANTKLKSQITTLEEENATLKQENLKVASLNNDIAILEDELSKLRATAPEQETVPPVPEVDNQAPKEYVVKGGDSLSSISKQFYGDPNKYNDIVSANNLSTTTLYSGQKLIIP